MSHEAKANTSGAPGVAVRHLVAGAHSNYAATLTELRLEPHYQGPAPHWHARTVKVCYVLEGTIAFTLGEHTLTATQGAPLLVRPRAAHTFWNPTAAPARLLIWASPAGYELFLAHLAAPVDPRELAALLRRSDTAFPGEPGGGQRPHEMP
jgi:mannose-6-phosphate isomerase-like protein (cupin superfamily)